MPNLKPAPQAKDPRHTKSTMRTSSKIEVWGWGEACLGLLPAVCYRQVPSLWLPQSQGTQACKPPGTKARQSRDIPWVATAKNRASNIKSKASTTYISLLQKTLELWGATEKECKDSALPLRTFSQTLDTCLVISLSLRLQLWVIANRPPSHKDGAPGSTASCCALGIVAV